jgi:glycine dehydrogenase subunit 1
MLQAMWEYQSMICDLTALPVSNVSVYDASTAAAEAITCAVRVHNRKASQKNTVWVSELLPPEKMSVIYNYCQGGGIILKTLLHTADGHVDLASAQSAAGSCGIYVEQPNCLGILDEGICGLKQIIGADTALIVAVQPTSLGLIEAPGNYGADIVVGEGQPLGSPLTFGGPIYGIFACTDKYLRQMPGRIIGRSIDGEGREAYCLTLSTREQHIRRHRATSNICTNETLIALMGAIHIAMLGPEGMRDLAIRNMAACQATKQRLAAIPRIDITHPNASHYNEFSITLSAPAADALAFLDNIGIIGGHDLGRWFSSRENELLICATDQTSAADIDALVNGLESWLEVIS